MHGGDIYNNKVDIDFSVSLNPCKRSLSEETLIKEAVSEGMRYFGNYPELSQSSVRRAVAAAEGVPCECIYAGNGTSELIMGIIRAEMPHKALLIEPGYSGYQHALGSVGDCEIRRYYLNEKDRFMLTEAVLDAVSDDIDMIFIQDPWNPVGLNADPDLMTKVIRKTYDSNITVLFDVSFRSLSENADKGVKLQDNIYYISSFTKSFALPGIRMGYVMSTETNIKNVISRLPEWNLSSIAQSVMKACAYIYETGDYLKRSVLYIKKEREYLTKELEDLGFKVYGSDTVFILFRTSGRLSENQSEGTAVRHEDLFERLLEKGILIRKCDDFLGLGHDFYRIGIRSHEENEILIGSLKEVIYGA